MTARNDIFSKLAGRARVQRPEGGRAREREPEERDHGALADRFERRAIDADSVVLHWAGFEEMLRDIAATIAERNARRVLISPVAHFDASALISGLLRKFPEKSIMGISEILEREESREERMSLFASIDLYIGAALAGFADSGAVIIRTSPTEGRTPSLLAETHLCVLSEKEIHPDLAAYPGWSESGEASDVIVIGGPSKTADIEKVLVKGVHGPRAFIIGLWSG